MTACTNRYARLEAGSVQLKAAGSTWGHSGGRWAYIYEREVLDIDQQSVKTEEQAENVHIVTTQ